MNKSKVLNVILALLVVAAIVFGLVMNGQKNNFKSQADELTKKVESLTGELSSAKKAGEDALKTAQEEAAAAAEAAASEAAAALEAAKAEGEAAVEAVKAEAAAAAETAAAALEAAKAEGAAALEAAKAEAAAAAETAAAEAAAALEAVKAQAEADTQKAVEEAVAQAKAEAEKAIQEALAQVKGTEEPAAEPVEEPAEPASEPVEEPVAEADPTHIIAHKANGIVIDGSLADWNLSSPAVVEDPLQIIRDAVFWQGPNDSSAKFYLSWDEENLYFAADVTEDTPLGAIEMLPIDGEDNLKLYISTDPTADPERQEYGTNDFLIYFVMDEGFWDTAIDRSMVPKDSRQRFVSIGMDGGENVLPGYQCAVQMTATGFTFEAVIPWADLSEQNTNAKKNKVPLYTPAVGDVLSCDFVITDIGYPCPGTEYIPQLAWTGNQKINTNPSLWGSVTLAE